MDAAAVAEYLKENPRFFEDYADVIAEIFVPHPHGGHAIPIAERQIVTLREKIQDLEAKFKELVAYGTENDQISEKVHRSTLALFAAPDLETTLAVLYHSLKEDFGVPQVAARLWGKVPEQSYLHELAATSSEIRQYADQLGQPYCGPVAAFESREWFEDGDVLHSFAFLPLRTAQTFGVLALGSPDGDRFHPGMALADMATVEKQLAKYSKTARSGGDKEAQRIVVALEKVLPVLNEAKPARTASLTKEDQLTLAPFFLLTMKPTMYVANVSDHGFKDNPLLDAVIAHAKNEGAPVVAVCAEMEAQIADLDGDDKTVFLDDMGMTEPGLDRVIHAGYALLGLQTYFTAGPKEVRAWTIHRGDTAPQAAGVIHTDFEKGFIRAEVIAYDDYVACKGEQGAKDKGKMRLEGKEYVVKDGDVMHFRFNV